METKERNKAIDVAKFAAAALSLATIISCLLGYGVSLGYEATIGVPHSSLYANVIDLLDLSAFAYADLVTAVDKAVKISTSGAWAFFENLFVAGWRQSWFGSLIFTALLVLGIYFWLSHLFGVSSKNSVRNVLSSWRAKILAPMKRRWVRVIVSILMGPIILFAMIWLEFLALAVAVSIMVLPVVVGYAAGAHQACAYVSGHPSACRSSHLQPAAHPSSYVMARIKGQVNEVSGYLVLSTPSDVLLWERCKSSYALVPVGQVQMLSIVSGALVCPKAQPH